MNTTKETTATNLLSNILKLHELVKKDPHLRMTETCKRLGITRCYVREMVKGGVITNKGSKRYPEWMFTEVYPNIHMAKEVITRCNKREKQYRERKALEEENKGLVHITDKEPQNPWKKQNDTTPLDDLEIGGLYCCALSLKSCQYLGNNKLLMWDDVNCCYTQVQAYKGMLFYNAEKALQ